MKITYNGRTYNYDEWHQEIVRQARAGKKWCCDCVHHSEVDFLSWTEHYCDLHDSLDLIFAFEPNDVANKCPDYVQKEGKRWFE